MDVELALTRLAVAGLKACDKPLPVDLVSYLIARHGIDPAAIKARVISPALAELANEAHPGLFDDDDLEFLSNGF